MATDLMSALATENPALAAGMGGLSAASSLLFGDDSSTTQKQTTTTELDDLFKQLVATSQDTEMSREERQTNMENLLGQINQTMQTATVSLAEEEQQLAKNNLDLISKNLLNTLSTDYSPARAKALAEDARNRAIDKVLRAGMGGVIEAGTKAGAYDSTVQSDAASQVAARAAEQGSNAELNLQSTFAQLGMQKAQTLTSAMQGLFGILKGAETTTAQSSQQATTQQSQSKTDVTGSQTSSTDTTQQTESERTQDQTTEVDATTETDEEGLLDKIFG